MKKSEKNWRHTHTSCSHSWLFRNEKTSHVLCTKKTKWVCQNRSKNIFLKKLILSFLHRSHGMSFHSEKIHECEQLVCVCLQFFSDFFHEVLLFFYFRAKKAGAGELRSRIEFPLSLQLKKKEKKIWFGRNNRDTRAQVVFVLPCTLLTATSPPPQQQHVRPASTSTPHHYC